MDPLTLIVSALVAGGAAWANSALQGLVIVGDNAIQINHFGS
jgi:hypothetical protein